ncbi:ABC transporter permease [Chitinophaga pendula]|uniref:ABC transporter permease n=1 Tax=Chitinophaga TaxID=79328 RepID=UPI000BAEC157|nr:MULTISPECIES: ABC transporter permease [Chitinophaga]ASZ10915.1 hypothetical protein CK934_07970 [Chitinophaga sp. MD30]UCJ06097.1 ABC transporter permease [Chitinophaga pendula]
MVFNYIKIAWRNLLKNKIYSAINILGLAIGVAVTILIGLWVYHEYSYDKFLPGYQQVYQVKRNFDSNGNILTFNTTSLKLANTLRNEIPEIKYLAETDWSSHHGLKVGDRKFYQRGMIVGEDFLKIFQFPLLQGDVASVLKDPFSIVLSASTAIALFDSEDVIGKTVRVDNLHDLKVTGILKDIPSNSTLQFQYLVPFKYLVQINANVKATINGSYGDNGFQQFIALQPGASLEKVAAKIQHIEKTEKSFNAQHSEVILHGMDRWHLYSQHKNGKEAGGFIEYVRIFSIIGILVLIIACINFINLTTARSEKRAKEIGIRKAIGSLRAQLIIQLLMESFLYTVMAFGIALIVVQLVLPAFNQLTGAILSLPLRAPLFWVAIAGGIIVTALLAGSRPAFYLSSFHPIKTLKGRIQNGKAAGFSRKALVVVQFSCSIILIISTIVIYQQMQYVKQRPTGYNIARLVSTNMNNELSGSYDALRAELLSSGLVEHVSASSSHPTGIYWHTNIEQWPGKIENESIEMGVISVTRDYFHTMGIQLLQGHPFRAGQDSMDIILNQTAVTRLRLKDPIGTTILWNGKSRHIAGVVNDALMSSPFTTPEPTMFLAVDHPASDDVMLYRLSANVQTSVAMEKLSRIFNKYEPAFPYTYDFTDNDYNEKFKQEVLTGRLSGLFAALAIFISCLGLFGLATYTAEQRTKEIGLRKVLGASVSQLWLLLTQDFLLLVGISCLIASPLAFYFLQQWLDQYDYRIRIHPGVFLMAALIAILITLLTVSFQTVRAALANPVKNLRTE